MSNRKVIIGVNDIATIRPDIFELLKDKNDGYKYVCGSGKYVTFKCPDCKTEFDRQISDVNKRGLICNSCGFRTYEKPALKHFMSQECFLEKIHSFNPDINTDDIYINNKCEMNFYCKKGHKWTSRADEHMYQKNGCPYCSGSRAIIGETDLATTRPDVAKLLKNKADALKYKEHSNAKVMFVCPNCKNEIKRVINNVSKRGLKCNLCSDGVSYPNKVMGNILEQLKVKYVSEYIIKPEKYKYDFFIPDRNIIIEMHGKQHYEECTLTSRTLDEEVLNDKNKYDYAIKHGVEIYIVVNCSVSNIEYIKNNILNTEFKNIYDLDCIDWKLCELHSSGSMITKSAELYNNGCTVKDIMNKLNASKSGVTSWLNTAEHIGLIKWDKHNSFKDLRKQVVLVNTGEQFDSLTKAGKKYHVDYHGISSACKNKKEYCGKHPETGEKLRWMYLEDYNDLYNNTKINKGAT